MDTKRLVMTVVAVGAALTAAAMPTKKELQTAQEMVADVTESDVKALKSGAKKPAEVAAKHMELAAQAGSEAEKYLLLQGAFKLYAKAGDYDAAADALGTMNREIADMNPEVIVDIYNQAIFSSMKEKAPKLFAIKEAARRQVFYRKQLAKAEAAVKANPKDPAAQKKLGECHAELGDWTKALDAFANAGGDLAKSAKAESDGSLKPQELGDFWWDYSDAATYRLHAAALYRTALADDSFKGLARTRADQRVKEAEMEGVVLPQKDKGRSSSQNMSDGLLAHRWSFNKDFVDSVGKVEGRKLGKNVRLVGGRCECRSGGLDLGMVLKNVAGSFTIECWYREEGRVYGTRVIASGLIRQKGNRELLWATGTGKEGYFDSGNAQPKRGAAEMQFELRHRYYLAVSYNGKEVVAYKADLDGDRYLRSYCAPQNEVWANDTFRIGINCADPSGEKGEDLAVADYEEIRIWKTALSKTDIEKSYKLGPDKVPAVGGGSSIAPAKAAAAASAKPMSLELAKGINLELMPCPAGEFEMGRHEFAKVDGLYPHKVKISRPFWLSKNRVTFEQFETFRKTDVWKDEKVKQIIELLGGRQCPVNRIARADFDQFCRYLGQKYSSKIPKGYVFRLPTDAEWAYAFRANSQDPDDPYALDGNDYKRFRKVAPANSVGWQWPEIDKMLQEKGLKSKEGRVAPKVGTRAANKWGIQDLDDCGAELVLDVIDVRKDNPHPHWRLCNFDNKSFCYGAYEFDPLRLY